MLCAVPGDPFPIDFDNQSDPFLIVNLENPFDEINFTSAHLSSTTLKATPIENLNTTLLSPNKTDKLSASSTSKPVLNTLPIHKKQ